MPDILINAEPVAADWQCWPVWRMDQKIAGRVEGEQFFLPASGGQDAACGVVTLVGLAAQWVDIAAWMAVGVEGDVGAGTSII